MKLRDSILAGFSRQAYYVLAQHGFLQTNFPCYVLVSSRFLFVRLLPALQIPNFKTSAIAHKSDFAFQSKALPKIYRQNEAALAISHCMLSARM